MDLWVGAWTGVRFTSTCAVPAHMDWRALRAYTHGLACASCLHTWTGVRFVPTHMDWCALRAYTHGLVCALPARSAQRPPRLGAVRSNII
eukprot:358772-Chlamydomonas_euryale.AAC.25